MESKNHVDILRTKDNIDTLLKSHVLYLCNDNRGIEDYLGKDCTITYIVYDEEGKYFRYLIDIDNGDYWWVNECFDN
jgi:hypothetical protein